jgi:uncharacterized protein YoxC
MPLLGTIGKQALGKLGLESLLDANTKNRPRGPDFDGGFVIEEYINGKKQSASNGFGLTLTGVFMPQVPFAFGGKQEIKKDYYAGNSEPVVQVLGPREENVSIKGRFKTRKFKDQDFIQAAQEFQEQCDAIRLRGNLLYLRLGEWHRWGFLEETKFELNRLTDIGYELSFSIIGFNPPKNCKLIDQPSDDIIAANKKVIADTNAALATMTNIPASMPRTLADVLNAQIDIVANAIGLVTSFIDGILSDAESVTRSANRALGLIKNAQATISQTGRRVGAISLDVATLGAGFSSAAEKTEATYNNTVHFKKIATSLSSFQTLLAALRIKYAALVDSVPLKRHLVKDGDTLQRLAMFYYNDADLWKKIYDHNKLLTTDLAGVQVLEIPRN